MFIVNKIALAIMGLALAFLISSTQETQQKIGSSPLKSHQASQTDLAQKLDHKSHHNRW